MLPRGFCHAPIQDGPLPPPHFSYRVPVEFTSHRYSHGYFMRATFVASLAFRCSASGFVDRLIDQDIEERSVTGLLRRPDGSQRRRRRYGRFSSAPTRSLQG